MNREDPTNGWNPPEHGIFAPEPATREPRHGATPGRAEEHGFRPRQARERVRDRTVRSAATPAARRGSRGRRPRARRGLARRDRRRARWPALGDHLDGPRLAAGVGGHSPGKRSAASAARQRGKRSSAAATSIARASPAGSAATHAASTAAWQARQHLDGPRLAARVSGHPPQRARWPATRRPPRQPAGVGGPSRPRAAPSDRRPPAALRRLPERCPPGHRRQGRRVVEPRPRGDYLPGETSVRDPPS